MVTHAQSQHAFLPGCDLWVISQKTPKSFSLKLDWYINFQISKGQRHHHSPRSKTLTAWVNQTELNIPEIEAGDSSPLVIAANDLLPCRWIHYSECADLSKWVESIQPFWSGLGKPSLKFFLPEGENSKDLIQAWKPFDPLEEYVIVHFSPVAS